jgi:hypothetical protein
MDKDMMFVSCPSASRGVFFPQLPSRKKAPLRKGWGFLFLVGAECGEVAVA